MLKSFYSLIFVIVGIIFMACSSSPSVKTDNHESTSKSSLQELTTEDKITLLANILHQPIIKNETKMTLAILDFDNNKDDNIGKLVHGIFLETFFLSGKFKIIERNELDKILNEQSVQLSGYIDDDTAKSIGKIIGVDYICYGSIDEYENYTRVQGKITAIETGEIVSVSSVNLDVKNNTDASQTKIENQENWFVKKVDNKFDDITVYTITTNGALGSKLFIGYVKHHDPIRSYVRIGTTGWNIDQSASFDIKPDDGSIHNIILSGINWMEDKGDVFHVGSTYVNKNNSRLLFSLFTSNDTITIRCNNARQSNKIAKYDTRNIEQALIQNGLSYTEILQAIENEEF